MSASDFFVARRVSAVTPSGRCSRVQGRRVECIPLADAQRIVNLVRKSNWTPAERRLVANYRHKAAPSAANRQQLRQKAGIAIRYDILRGMGVAERNWSSILRVNPEIGQGVFAVGGVSQSKLWYDMRHSLEERLLDVLHVNPQIFSAYVEMARGDATDAQEDEDREAVRTEVADIAAPQPDELPERWDDPPASAMITSGPFLPKSKSTAPKTEAELFARLRPAVAQTVAVKFAREASSVAVMPPTITAKPMSYAEAAGSTPAPRKRMGLRQRRRLIRVAERGPQPPSIRSLGARGGPKERAQLRQAPVCVAERDGCAVREGVVDGHERVATGVECEATTGDDLVALMEDELVEEEIQRLKARLSVLRADELSVDHPASTPPPSRISTPPPERPQCVGFEPVVGHPMQPEHAVFDRRCQPSDVAEWGSLFRRSVLYERPKLEFVSGKSATPPICEREAFRASERGLPWDGVVETPVFCAVVQECVCDTSRAQSLAAQAPGVRSDILAVEPTLAVMRDTPVRAPVAEAVRCIGAVAPLQAAIGSVEPKPSDVVSVGQQPEGYVRNAVRRLKEWWSPAAPNVDATAKARDTAYKLAWTCAHPVETDDMSRILSGAVHGVGQLGLRERLRPTESEPLFQAAWQEVHEAKARTRRFVRRAASGPCAYGLRVAIVALFMFAVFSTTFLLASASNATFDVDDFSSPAHFGVGAVLGSLIALFTFGGIPVVMLKCAYATMTYMMFFRFTELYAIRCREPETYDAAMSDGLLNTRDFILPLVQGAYRLQTFMTDTVCLGYGDETKLGGHCKVTCEKNHTCLSPNKAGAQLVGWSTGPAYVLRKCLCNAHNALCHRHGSQQPPISATLEDAYIDFASVLTPAAGDYYYCSMREFLVWLAKWPLGKARAILLSRDRDEVLPRKVKAMVKVEVNHKLPTKARLIQFYKNLATQSEFGPEYYALQKTICSVLRNCVMPSGSDVTFSSGMSAVEIARWMDNVNARGPVTFYERDGKNWDSSMQSEHARFRQAIYRLFDADLADFASQCDKVSGFACFPGGVLRYKMDYTVKSGHNDTTLGNSLVNAAIAYSALKRAGVRGSILVAGDDLLVACYDEVSAERLISLEREYGITPEARCFRSYAEVSFISGIWMSDGVTMAFLPQPGRLFARLWWTTKPPSRRNVEAYQRSVAKGLLPACNSVPLISTLLQKFDSAGKIVPTEKGYTFRGSGFSLEKAGMLLAFALRYGLDESAIVDCDAFLKTLPAMPLLLVHPVLQRMSEVDNADIAERGRGVWD